MGTAFYVSRAGSRPGESFRYTVTAAHVIRKLKSKGVAEIVLRCNKKGGGVDHAITLASDWLMHPSREDCDVAILIGAPGDEADVTALTEDMIVSSPALSEADVGVGTDVFWTGLFTNHIGATRNETLVRSGRIAALPRDGVATELGSMNAYLIDGVPLGGFSGSPVYSNLGTLKTENGKVRTANNPIIRLIGMIHGHFTTDKRTVLGTAASKAVPPSMHTGIGVVIRADDIVEMLNQPAVLDAEARHRELAR